MAREMIGLALDGGTPAFEWTHLNAAGDPLACEVRLVSMPSSERRLVRGTIFEISERKRAERELADKERVAAAAIARSEERLRLVLESSRLGTWSYDADTDVLEFSEQAARLYGRRPEEMPRTLREALSLFHPDDQDVVRRRARGDVPMPTAAREYRIRLPNGDYRWIAGVGDTQEPEPNRSGGLLLDIHERKIAEFALRDREEELREVVDSVSAGIWVFDGTQILLVNAAAERLTGFTRERLAQIDSISEMLGPDAARDLIERALARLAGNDVDGRYEVQVSTPQGEIRRIELSGERITFRGKPAVIISAFDVTARHASEAALRESEARFRSLVDNSPDFITRVDSQLRHDFVNHTAEREAGLDPGKVLGRRADEIGFEPELAKLFLARQRQVLESGEPVEYEYAINSLADPANTAYRRARVVPELDQAGDVHHLLSIVTDITAQRVAERERKRLDLQMQHSQKLESLGVLAGGIAHDFNNLLVAILGNAGVALMELPPRSVARETIEDIETAAQRAAELTRQMLAYSGRGRFVIERLDLSRVVEEMAHLLQASINKRAELSFQFAQSLPPIEADATQLRQIVMNLILNASDAIGDHAGTITVRTGTMHADPDYLSGAYMDVDLPEGEYVFLEVADSGEGMDDETLARIFDPFFTTKFTGRGLGLAAVLGIVRGHRGAISVNSTPGGGATFRVLLPPTDEGAGRSAVTASDIASGAAGGRTILVIDDDQSVRAVTLRMLERAVFSVLMAEDGRSGLDVYAAHPEVALVLLDMTMPQMDGEETFREPRKIRPDATVLLTSGYNEQDATEHFIGAGLAGFIQKPYRPQELLQKIFEVIG
jgi:PAS domain S-box-containing protein